MTHPNVDALVDGELVDPAEVEALLAHLAECRRCQAHLTGSLQLAAMGQSYAEELRSKRGRRRAWFWTWAAPLLLGLPFSAVALWVLDTVPPGRVWAALLMLAFLIYGFLAGIVRERGRRARSFLPPGGT